MMKNLLASKVYTKVFQRFRGQSITRDDDDSLAEWRAISGDTNAAYLYCDAAN